MPNIGWSPELVCRKDTGLECTVFKLTDIDFRQIKTKVEIEGFAESASDVGGTQAKVQRGEK